MCRVYAEDGANLHMSLVKAPVSIFPQFGSCYVGVFAVNLSHVDCCGGPGPSTAPGPPLGL